MKTVFERTEWFRNAEYGFFFHFLNSGSVLHPPADRSQRVPAPPDEWNRIVDSFDTEKIAEQLHRLNAGYAFLTIGQNSGYYCAPNAVYDGIMGLSGTQSKCSRRDLISDFADALAKYGIPLMLYTTSLAPGYDLDAMRKLKSIPPWNCNANCGNYNDIRQFAGNDPRLREFQLMWNAIHAEWMRRWGKKVRGWWVDGSCFAEKMYAFSDEPNGYSFANALRTNNPDALVAFNPGVVYPPCAAHPSQDYLAGEINEPEYGLLNGPLADGMQYHVLSYAGQYWGQGPMRYNGNSLAAATRNITDNGGTVSWDLPFTVRGIDSDVFAVLEEFVEKYRHSKEVFPKTCVRITEPYRNAGGKEISGRVELESEREAEIKVVWNGVQHTGPRAKNRTLELPPTDGREHRLKLSCGGFIRELPVHIGRELFLTRHPSEPLVLKTEDGSRILGRYSCSVANDILGIRAEIFEKIPEIRKMPWECSCLEVFLAREQYRKEQICIRHDGKVFRVDKGVVEECPSVKVVPDGKGTDSFRLRVEVPLSLMQGFQSGDGTFRLDFQQSVKTETGVLRNLLFGSGAIGEFAKIIVK